MVPGMVQEVKGDVLDVIRGSGISLTPGQIKVLLDN